MATQHPLNKPSGQPQLPQKPRSLDVQPGQAFPCFHLPELLLVGYTQGYGEARAEYSPAHPGALAIGSSRSKESCQGEVTACYSFRPGQKHPAVLNSLGREGNQSKRMWGGSQTSPPAEVTGTAGSLEARGIYACPSTQICGGSNAALIKHPKS